MVLPLVEVYDGDTIISSAPVSGIPMRLSIRVLGIDTAERAHRAECDEERSAAEAAREYLITEIVDKAKWMVVYDYGWDKYGGRMLGHVIINGYDVGTSMIEEGHAFPYDGGTKVNHWCAR